MDISYIINELAEDRENYFNAVTPPIMQSSNFVFNTVNEMRNAFADEYINLFIQPRTKPHLRYFKKKACCARQCGRLPGV